MGKCVLVENREGHNWHSYRYNNQFPYFFSKIGAYLLKPADINGDFNQLLCSGPKDRLSNRMSHLAGFVFGTVMSSSRIEENVNRLM